MDLERLRDRCERFAGMAAAEEYEMKRSPGRDAGLGALHQRHAALFDLDRIAEAQRALSEALGTEERRARFLLRFLVEGRATCAAWKEVDRRTNFFRCRGLQVGERTVHVRQLDGWSTSEDVELRRRIEEEYLDAVDGEEATFQDHLSRRHGVYDELGYGSATEALEVVAEIDLRRLAAESSRFVDDTDGEYRDLLAWHLPRLGGVEAKDATALDLRGLRAPPAPGRELAARAPLSTLRPLLSQGGLDVDGGGRIVFDTQAEIASGERAACCALRVPDSIVVLQNRASEPRGHAAALSAVGQALHCAYTSRDLPVEFRRFGDPAVLLATGVLFESLLHQRAFLRDAYRLRLEQADEWRRYSALIRLMWLRRAATLLQLGLEWAEGAPVQEMRGRGAELLARALGARHDPRGTFALLELPVDSARVLRAEQLSALLAVSLRERFDEDWYRNPSGGEELRGMFTEGLRYTADERAVQLSSQPLGFRPVSDMIAEMLR